MSILVKISDIPVERVDKDLLITIEPKFGMGPTKYVQPYVLLEDKIVLPFAYATRMLKIPRPPRSKFPNIKCKFKGKLREPQTVVKKEAITCLNKRGSTMISAYCGFGKTILAVNIAMSIKFRTLIIVNKIVLMKQWEESILRFSPNAVVRRLTAKSPKKPADFYIMNAQNVSKKGRDFFDDVGLVIVDEAHMIMAETLSRSMQYVYPRYIIGLTATPYRPDGLDILLQFYFGRHKIVRKLHRKHIVYKVDTGFIPKIERTMQGRVNWGSILDQQANNEYRNELIVRIIKKMPI